MQAGMVVQALLHEATGQTSGFDIEQLHLVLDEQLDAAALAKAWTFVTRRHAALSASVDWTNSHSLEQHVHPEVEVAVETRSLDGSSPQEGERRLADFLREDRARGFNLRRAPLQRLTILSADDRVTEFVWTFHHFLLDGRSFSTVIREAVAAYVAFRDGTPLELAPAGRPFRDYIDWLQGRDFDDAHRHFRTLLRGKRSPTPLPFSQTAPDDRASAPSGDGRLAVEPRFGVTRRRVAPTLARRAVTLARDTSTTLGTVIQAVWAIVLARYTGDDDVVFGLVQSGRRSALDGEAQGMVGLLTNTLPRRIGVADRLTVGAMLAQIRAQTLAMRPFEHTSLLEIQRLSDLPPGTPLFQTLLLFENDDLGDSLRANSPIYRRVDLHEQPPFPLTVKVGHGSELNVTLMFERARFGEAAIERLLEAFTFTLEELSTDSQRLIRDVTSLPLAEREKILHAWNDTAAPFPKHALIHHAFEDRVRSQPDAIAVEADNVAFTYREIDDRANDLARSLRARGAAPDQRVAICVGRSPNLIVALLAVAKTGAAYVPLDPRYPIDRLRWMVDDAAVCMVLCESALQGLFSRPVALVDAVADREVTDPPHPDAVRPATADDPCYVIYTSGSTGMPKGVVLTHRAVVNTCDWVNRSFGVCPSDRALFVTSPSFDLSVYDVFGVLGAGATVVIASVELLADPASLAGLVSERRITLWNSAPAALQLMTPFLADRVDRSSLRLIMLSGDWIPLGLVRTLRRLLPAARIMSLGGATEAAIWSNWFPVQAIDPRWRSVPYGRPIQNCRYHVLDDHQRPVPVGVSGELYIGGVCLAEGYLGRPELSAERFVPDPFSEPGQRLFKTGDVARYFEDGNLELLGRRDRQVKIRGFRVELAEVDAALSAVQGVRATTCAVVADAADQRSIIGYVVPERGVELTEVGVKAELARVLPDFMIPARVMFIPALPLTTNGKVDLQALPRPEQAVAEGGDDGDVGDYSDTERQLAAIWSRLLHRSPVRRNDSFFALGGHSLLAVQLFDQINRVLGVKAPLAVLFDSPTLGLLASHLDRIRSSDKRLGPAARWTTLVPLQPSGSLPPFFCVAGVGGNPIGERRLARALGPHQTMYALQHRGVDGTHAPHRSIEAMAREFLSDITKVQPHGPYYLGGFSAGGVAAFEIARRLSEAGEQVALLVLIDTFHPRLEKWSSPERALLFGRIAYHYGVRYAARRLTARLALNVEQVARMILPGRKDAFERRLIALQAMYVAALEGYQPLPYHGATLLVRSDPSRCPDVDYRPDLTNGWGAIIGSTLEVHSIDCRHDELLEGHIEEVARVVAAGLGAARSRNGALEAPKRGPRSPV